MPQQLNGHITKPCCSHLPVLPLGLPGGLGQQLNLRYSGPDCLLPQVHGKVLDYFVGRKPALVILKDTTELEAWG